MDADTIRQSLEATYQENRALIAGLNDADLNRPSPNPHWKVRQLAAHVAEDDAGTLYVAKLLAQSKNAKAPDILVNVLNWWGLRKYKRAGVAELLPVMDRGHTELITWLDALPPEALERGGEISGMGRLTLAEFLVQNCEHSRAHAADIRTALNSVAV
jgi:hypothetical protein